MRTKSCCIDSLNREEFKHFYKGFVIFYFLFFFYKQANILKKAISREAYRKYTRLQTPKTKNETTQPLLGG